MTRLRRHFHSRPAKPGPMPVMAAVDPQHTPCMVNVIGYGPSGYEEIELTDAKDLEAFARKWPVTWVDVDGLGNTELILSLGQVLGLDRLVLEDIFDASHLPKVEEYDNSIFMILKNGLMEDGEFVSEQISMVLMPGMVVVFEEKPGESFKALRQHIRSGKGRIHQFGSDFLAYAIINAVLEGYYPILDAMKKRLDAIEDTFLEKPGKSIIRQIHDVKNELLFVHSAVWPVHDITMVLAQEDCPLVTAGTVHYLRDAQDQAKQVKDLSEFYRLIASDLMNTYLAFSDNQANQVMKLLTMVATIFIPLSFIAGFYGMNFDPAASPYNMPELKMRYGYPCVIALMLMVTGGLLWMFKRKGWIGKGND